MFVLLITTQECLNCSVVLQLVRKYETNQDNLISVKFTDKEYLRHCLQNWNQVSDQDLYQNQN